jgi:hypothetical protein
MLEWTPYKLFNMVFFIAFLLFARQDLDYSTIVLKVFRTILLSILSFSILAIAGSLGFIVITDLWYRISGKTKGIYFTSKIIIYGFAILLFIGTFLTYFTEPLVSQTGESALIQSFFQAMTAMTTVGFNTIATGNIGAQQRTKNSSSYDFWFSPVFIGQVAINKN